MQKDKENNYKVMNLIDVSHVTIGDQSQYIYIYIITKELGCLLPLTTSQSHKPTKFTKLFTFNFIWGKFLVHRTIIYEKSSILFSLIVGYLSSYQELWMVHTINHVVTCQIINEDNIYVLR